MNDQQTRRQIQAVLAQYEPKRTDWPALQGDGLGNLHVSGQDGWIYVRVGSDKIAWRAFNDRFPSRNDLACVVGYDSLHPNLFQVLSLGKLYAAADSGDKMIPAVIEHGHTHQLDHPDGGYDPTYIQKQAIVCLLASETDPASMQVNVAGDRYPWQEGWKEFPGALSASLSGYVPTASGQARYVLISVDGETNLLQYTVGATWAIYLPPADLSTLIPNSPMGSVPSVAVYLPYGTTSLTRTGNLHDVRIIVSPVGGSLLPAVHDHSEDAQGGLLPATSTEFEEIGTATYDDVQDWLNLTQSAGRFTGGAITDNGDGTIDVAAGSGFIKIIDANTGATRPFDWSLATGLIPTDNSVSWVEIDYNAGAPVVGVSNTWPSNRNTKFTIARIFRNGNTLHILQKGQNAYNLGMRTHRYLVDIFHYQRASGVVTSESGTRKVAMTAGYLFRGLNQIPVSALDTNVADTFTYVYRDGSGGWTEATAQTTIDNAQYDDGDGVLDTLTPNQYGVHWVYLTADNKMYIQYGQDSYKLAEAETAPVPATTLLLTKGNDFAILVARIIIEASGAAFTSVAYPWTAEFTGSAVSVHNNLAGLNDGDYKHLTAAEYAALGSGGGDNTMALAFAWMGV